MMHLKITNTHLKCIIKSPVEWEHSDWITIKIFPICKTDKFCKTIDASKEFQECMKKVYVKTNRTAKRLPWTKYAIIEFIMLCGRWIDLL